MFSKHKMYKKNMQMSYSKMSFTYSKEKSCSWDKLLWWTFFTAEATGLKLQLSHYPVSLLSQCMMRREFVWPPWGSTKGWIQCGAPRGQAGGGPSWGAPASHHLHTAACPVSLDMNSPTTPILPPLTPTTPPLPWQASSASQSYPTPTPNICIWSVHHTAWIYVTATLWPQLRTLFSFCHWADFQILRWCWFVHHPPPPDLSFSSTCEILMSPGWKLGLGIEG